MNEQSGYSFKARTSATVSPRGDGSRTRPPVQQGRAERETESMADVLPCPDPDTQYDDWTSTRTPNSTISHRRAIQQATRRDVVHLHVHNVPRRAHQTMEQPMQALPPAGQAAPPYARRFHWSVYVGLFLLVLIVGWLVINIIASWWTHQQDAWRYGYPRTFQTDAQVGHDAGGAVSHFIATNEHGRIKVIEEPGTDASKTKVYVIVTLVGAGSDLYPVTLHFQDINHDQKLDMLVIVNGTQYTYINDNGQFRPATPQDKISEQRTREEHTHS